MKAVVPFLLLLCFAVIPNTEGATFQEARVSQVIQDVRLLTSNAAARQAVVNDKIREGTAVRTGTQSRAELTFADLTITRLGENTIFSLNAAAREIRVDHGSILIEVPPKSAAARITSAAVTAAVQGGTALFGTGPPTKFMVLEGVGTLYPNAHPEEMVTLHSGEMIMLTADGHLTTPQKFDVKTVLKSSALIVDFPALANLPLILAVVDQQQTDQSLIASASPAQSPPSQTIIDVISVNTTANPAVTQTPSPPPAPTPSESGTPSVISSPNPYVITNGTTIKTDTSITTNGSTDFGKIYHGPTQDGPFTLWAYGSTSAFETTAIKLDTEFFADPNNLPLAVFKFQSLLLTGNPTIDTTNGGATKLGLIGVDGISSGPPGGTLTFSGLSGLYMGTVDGPINLTSDVSFQGLSLLAIYARGAGSDLTINSPISGISALKMAAENSIQISNPGTMSVGLFDATAGNDFTMQIGGSLSLNGRVKLETFILPNTTLTSGGNVTLNVGSDYTNSSSTDFSRLQVMNEGHIGTGGNISVDITGNLTAAGLGSATAFPEPGDVELLVQNTNAQIDTGGNLNLTVRGNVNVNGLALYVQNYDETANPAGHIGTGGNIDVQVHGNLTTHSYVDVFLNNRGGGMIDSGGNLTFNVSGALTIGSDAGGGGASGFGAEFTISNRFDNVGGNTSPSTIGSSVSLNLHAASVDIAGLLFGSGISNAGGSTIQGNASVLWDVPGNVTIHGTNMGTAPNNSTTDSWFINNQVVSSDPGGGTIQGNATLTLNIRGNLALDGDAQVSISNQRNRGATSPSGGLINGKASVDIAANNFTVGGELDIDIFNQNRGVGTGSGGTINGDATLTVNLRGDLSVTGLDPNSGSFPGGAYFDIRNTNPTTGSGGSIVGNALLTITAGNITTKADFDAEIDNQLVFQGVGPSGGSIGSDAKVQITATSLTVGGELDVIINNRNNGTNGTGARSGGTITGAASINLTLSGSLITTGLDSSANSIGIPGNANFQILNENFTSGSGGSIGSDATIDVSAANISTSGRLDAEIDNPNGGSIGRNATVQIGTTGNVTTNSLFVDINNANGGVINGNATVNMNVSGTATVTNDATVQIIGSNPVGSAAINFNGGSYNVGGTFLTSIDGDGTLTFTNTDLHANVVKAGVFGANGSLIIGGSGSNTISANTLLHLYAPGSNGLLKFVASVTLSSGTTMDLAANTITINSGVTVTIAGAGGPANVYTGFTNSVPNANYTGFGGNGSTTGTFAGNGANNPQPLANAPVFGAALSSPTSSGTTNASTQTSSDANVTSSTKPTAQASAQTTGQTINVSDSAQLLSLLNATAPGADGRVRIRASNSSKSLQGSKRITTGGRLESNAETLTAKKVPGKAATVVQRTELPQVQ